MPIWGLAHREGPTHASLPTPSLHRSKRLTFSKRCAKNQGERQKGSRQRKYPLYCKALWLQEGKKSTQRAGAKGEGTEKKEQLIEDRAVPFRTGRGWGPAEPSQGARGSRRQPPGPGLLSGRLPPLGPPTSRFPVPLLLSPPSANWPSGFSAERDGHLGALRFEVLSRALSRLLSIFEVSFPNSDWPSLLSGMDPGPIGWEVAAVVGYRLQLGLMISKECNSTQTVLHPHQDGLN